MQTAKTQPQERVKKKRKSFRALFAYVNTVNTASGEGRKEWLLVPAI
jgi:hypothetical protein